MLQLVEQLPLTAQTGMLRPIRLMCPASQRLPPPQGFQTHGDVLGTVPQHCQGTVGLEHRESRDATLRRRGREGDGCSYSPCLGLGSSLRFPPEGRAGGSCSSRTQS